VAAACGPPTTLRAAQVFVSPYPAKASHANEPTGDFMPEQETSPAFSLAR
jgi:hypothetical protein